MWRSPNSSVPSNSVASLPGTATEANVMRRFRGHCRCTIRAATVTSYIDTAITKPSRDSCKLHSTLRLRITYRESRGQKIDVIQYFVSYPYFPTRTRRQNDTCFCLVRRKNPEIKLFYVATCCHERGLCHSQRCNHAIILKEVAQFWWTLFTVRTLVGLMMLRMAHVAT